MFTQRENTRKRDRDDTDDDGYHASGFSEHRSKRRIAALPHRISPKQSFHASPPFGINYTSQPPPSTITPADSDSEDTPAVTEPRSFFSPYSSSPTQTINPSSPFLQPINSSHSTQMSDLCLYNDDMEMSDSIHFSPGSFQSDPSASISSRIPTPIHSSFAPFIRTQKVIVHQDTDFGDDDALVDRFRRGRRLPSPISEGETSPSVILEGLGDMQMEYEGPIQEPEKCTPTRKGHTRSKHSIRSWTAFGTELGGPSMKRSFSMGYRPDCEKCRNKVPGHFNHIITY